MENYTRNEWGRWTTTLEASGEDGKLHSKRVENSPAQSQHKNHQSPAKQNVTYKVEIFQKNPNNSVLQTQRAELFVKENFVCYEYGYQKKVGAQWIKKRNF